MKLLIRLDNVWTWILVASLAGVCAARAGYGVIWFVSLVVGIVAVRRAKDVFYFSSTMRWVTPKWVRGAYIVIGLICVPFTLLTMVVCYTHPQFQYVVIMLSSIIVTIVYEIDLFKSRNTSYVFIVKKKTP